MIWSESRVVKICEILHTTCLRILHIWHVCEVMLEVQAQMGEYAQLRGA